MLLNVEQVSKSYGLRQLLDNVTFYLTEGDRLGVIGVNGTGKSTLLRVAARVEEPDEGSVTTDPNVRIGYLSQNPSFNPDNTIMQQVFEDLDPTARALAEYEAVEILTRLGITDRNQKMGELSGGQVKRVSIASALVHPTDVLILDEPTNHLDAQMITYLEEYLSRYNGAILMVTHDRYFLERVCNRVMEISFGKNYFYDGGYSSYLDGKARREEMQAASESKRQNILRRELAWVLRGPQARGTKSRERLERYEKLKNQLPPEYQEDMGNIQAISSRLGKKTIEFYGVSKHYGDKQVLQPFDFNLQRDDRIGIIGRNGSGKSTLLNLFAGTVESDTGEASWGETVKIGYFTQTAAELDPNMRAIDYIKEEMGSLTIPTPEGPMTATRLMEKFLFNGDMQYQLIGKLSGGERKRLFLLGILAAAPNILLLDEPTNDLDIPTLTVLEDYLETFPGAIVAVSHDRYFLDRICHRTFIVDDDGKVRLFQGSYTDYVETLQQAVKPVSAPKASSSESRKHGEYEKPKSTKLKFTFKEQREYETIDDDIAALEDQIAQLEQEEASLTSQYVRLSEIAKEKEELSAKLDEKMERWVYLNDLAEKIAAQ